jgi:mannose-6-phosphate isomerase-like protein (cupin superfamily)
VEAVRHNGEELAIIVRASHQADGIEFFTPKHYSQQLACMGHCAGKIIEPHVHNAVSREVTYTQEVLFVRKGVLRVDFYSPQQTYLKSRTLRAGDVIMLAAGGHGFEVLEDVEMIEVKQGPYLQGDDKMRFQPKGSEGVQSC